jgi:hypothetical protein
MSSDLHSIGFVVGCSVGAAAGAFAIARKLFGPGGSAELERLKRIAGVEEGTPRGSRWRDWTPYFMAAAAGALGLLVGLTVVGANRNPAFSVSDLPTLRRETVSGCQKKCVSEGSAEDWCTNLCACFMRELTARYPREEELANWFGAAARRTPERVEEILAIRAGCVDRLARP